MWDNRSHSSSPFFCRGNTFLQQLLGVFGKSNGFYYIISSLPPLQPHDLMSGVRTARLCCLAVWQNRSTSMKCATKVNIFVNTHEYCKIYPWGWGLGGGWWVVGMVVGSNRCVLFLLSCNNVYCWGHSFQRLITRFNKEIKPSPNLDSICVCVVLFSNYNKVCTARLTLLFSFSFQN